VGGTHALLQISEHLLHIYNRFPACIIVFGGRHHGQVHFLGLELQLCARYSRLKLLDGLIPLFLVNVLGLLAGLFRGRNRGKFERKGELEVCLGNDFGFLRVEFLLVLECASEVLNGGGVAVLCQRNLIILKQKSSLPFLFER